MKLSLGPIQYYWSKETLLEFYRRIADTPVDIVYLGETVCSKRRSLRTEEWFELGEKLEAAGKEVVFSTLALIEAESELIALRKQCSESTFTVEANDMAAVKLLADANTPFYTGPTINIYNGGTLNFLATQGLKRWVLPPEISRDTLRDILGECADGIETEVMVYGRIPLAFSARCFTARAHNLQKDNCADKCIDDPDGMTLYTREDEAFLTINGVQTQSAQTYNLINELDEMKEMGVDIVRISPQSEGTEQVIQAYADVLTGKQTGKAMAQQLETIMPIGPCSGYWYGEAGMVAHLENIEA